MSTMFPAVSIVVPCRNEIDHIEVCVRPILAQEPSAEGLEVIVAEGMSNDRTRDILERLAREDLRLQIVDNPSRIVPTGLNTAIRVTQGRIIIRMDEHKDWLRLRLRVCISAPGDRADNVGGPWVAKGFGYMRRAMRSCQ